MAAAKALVEPKPQFFDAATTAKADEPFLFEVDLSSSRPVAP
ncbi:hypothetical protein ABIH81_21675 [Micromonospora sp. HUAS YX12]|uniref:Uncharacterized protein n=1 Tax=Micromonospora sp. HUAS YX12 TaxID=3156396 RepID=A0AAU7QVX5_9ACTN